MNQAAFLGKHAATITSMAAGNASTRPDDCEHPYAADIEALTATPSDNNSPLWNTIGLAPRLRTFHPNRAA